MAEEIVKVQLPQFTNDPTIGRNTALVYAEGRSRTKQQEIPEDIAKIVRKKGGKAFYYARYQLKRWSLTRLAPWQLW